MMRFEIKHQEHTQYSSGRNVINLTQSIGELHQSKSSSISDTYKDIVETGKMMEVKSDAIKNINWFFQFHKELFEVKWVVYNGFNYRKEHMLFHTDFFFEIARIFTSENKFYFLCSCYEFVELNGFLNSLEIDKRSDEYVVIEYDALLSKKPYEMLKYDSKAYTYCS